MKKWTQLILSLIITIIVIGEQIQIWPSQIIQRLEWIAYDQRVQHSQSHQADPNIIIVDIDEYSLQTIGHWPWPREIVAKLIKTLFIDYTIQLLGMDIVFAERMPNPWQQQIMNYSPELIADLNLVDGDVTLGLALEQFPVVVAHYFERTNVADTEPSTTPEQSTEHSLLPSTGVLTPPLQIDGSRKNDLQVPVATRYTANIEAIANSAVSGGFFDNPLIDGDGTFRRTSMLQAWQDTVYPSLSLAMLHTLLGQMPVSLDIQETGLEGIDIGGFYIPTDPHGGALVPFYGPSKTFTYIPAADILNRRTPLESLAGTIVLLGTSAPGLMDLRNTPVDAVHPGVEIHATLLAGMLAQEIKHEPTYAIAITVATLSLIAVFMTLAFPGMSALKLLLCGTGLLATHIIFNVLAWQSDLVLPLASGVVLILALTLHHLAANLWRENSEKKRVVETFGQYIPPKLVDDIVRRPKALNLEGREATLTVLFSDVRGFTSFAEQTPPAELTRVMNRLLTPLTESIHAQAGTIDKYMGDAIMAFWGAPLPDLNQASHAVQAAIDMQKAISALNEESGLTLSMGIGIHTGIMNVGNMGSKYRMAYTVLGDNVNIGSRIESLTKFYGVECLASFDTLQKLCREQFNDELHDSFELIDSVNSAELNFKVRLTDRVRVKGKRTPITLFEVINHLHSGRDRYIKSSNKAIALYLNAQFHESLAVWELHKKDHPEDSIADIYITRCQHYIESPPNGNWGGVYTHKEK